MFQYSNRYTVQVYNIDTNRWEEMAKAHTMDEAFEYAEKLIGFSKSHDTVEILDQQDVVVWSSDRPLVSQRMKDLGLEEQQFVAQDGSC